VGSVGRGVVGGARGQGQALRRQGYGGPRRPAARRQGRVAHAGAPAAQQRRTCVVSTNSLAEPLTFILSASWLVGALENGASTSVSCEGAGVEEGLMSGSAVCAAIDAWADAASAPVGAPTPKSQQAAHPVRPPTCQPSSMMSSLGNTPPLCRLASPSASPRADTVE
jgi:hypothetical protein